MAGAPWRKMADQARPGAADFFEGELDPKPVTFVAVVEQRDRPGELGPFGIFFGMVVPAVVCQLPHRASPPPPDVEDHFRFGTGPLDAELLFG